MHSKKEKVETAWDVELDRLFMKGYIAHEVSPRYRENEKKSRSPGWKSPVLFERIYILYRSERSTLAWRKKSEKKLK